MLYRSTVQQPVALPAALGTLCLRPVTVALQPAEIGSGLRVRRTDTGQEWAIGLHTLIPATNCTAVGDEEDQVAFLEHLLACLWAGRLSDLLITTDGPEIPLYDGSATELWAAVSQAGRVESSQPVAPLVVTEALELQLGDRSLAALPDLTRPGHACYSYLLEHPHPQIGRQFAQYCCDDDFGTQIAPARTFATAEQIRDTRGQEPGPEVEALCVIAYENRLSCHQPLGQPFARHKLLDLIGDLYLCGRPLQGAVMAERTGHGDNHAFLQRLLAAEGMYHRS